MLLSKRCYSSWREIQNEYDDYMASLEFATTEEIEDFLEREYSTLEPSAKSQIANFIASDAETKEITWYHS